MLPSPCKVRLGHRVLDHDEACSAFTHVATRQLARQPEADFVSRLQPVDCSSCRYPCSAAPGFYRRGTSLTSVRVTLWITTAIHSGHTLAWSDPEHLRQLLRKQSV